MHVAGWNEPFPTVVEQWFWRASAIYLVFSGLVWSALNMMGAWWFWYDMLAGHGSRRIEGLLLALCSVASCTVQYVVARVSLVVEAFISLRALPASAKPSTYYCTNILRSETSSP